MRRTTQEAGLTAVVVLGGCVALAILVGTQAAAWCAGACVVGFALVLRSHLGRTPVVLVRSRTRERSDPAYGYPRYDKLCATVSWGLRDPRYFERMLRPLLRDIALDLQRGAQPDRRTKELRAALGERFAWLLDEPGTPAAAAAPRQPDQRELAALLDRLEQLERAWT